MNLIADVFLWSVANPKSALMVVGLLALSFIAGAFVGADYGAGHCAKAEVKAVTKAVATANTVTLMTQSVATKQEVARDQRRTFEQHNQQETTRNVQKNPTYQQCGLDADGLRLWNERNQSIDPTTGESDSALPLLAAHLGWHAPQSDQQPPTDHQPISRLPEAARLAGRMGDAEGAPE